MIPDDDPCPGIGEQLGAASFGELGVQWDTNGAGGEDAQLGDDEADGTVETDGDAVAWTDAQPVQACCEVLSGLIQFTVGDPGGSVRDGDRLGVESSLVPERICE